MARIFLSLHPFYESGKLLGRKQANMGFINALFRRDPFDEYHFFVHNTLELINFWKEIPPAKTLFEQGKLKAFERHVLLQHLKTTAYSICHFSGPITEFAALCHARNAFAPHIFPVTAINHSINYIEHAEKTLSHIWQGCTIRDGIACTSNTSKIIVQSRYDTHRKAYNLPEHWREPQLKIIPLGVPNPTHNDNAELGAELRAELRQKLKLDSESVMLLLLGRIDHADKMDIRPLFCALRRIRKEQPELKLLLFIAGSMAENSPMQNNLLELAKAWDINIAISTNISEKLKEQLFAAADIFISPSDNIQESFGLTLVEAAQAGLPTIASDWNGYKDIVVHEQTGLLVKTIAPSETPELDIIARATFNGLHQLQRAQQTAIDIPKLTKAIIKLAEDETLRKSMGKAAKERAIELYSFDAIIEQWLNFWEELEHMPISAEEESIIRSAKHPLTLDFGKVFACYASTHLQGETILQCTDLGLACLEAREPWNNVTLITINVKQNLLVELMQQAKTACSVEALLAVAMQSDWGKDFTEEELFAHILWLLKQDMLEYVRE